MSEYFISCDWGTSNFRLRLVEKSTLKVIQVVKASKGIKKLNQDLGTNDRLDFFIGFLEAQINDLPYEAVSKGQSLFL
jgi:2-dehydro-3-deoxygalactonokinase